jgi:hypothetical protein
LDPVAGHTAAGILKPQPFPNQTTTNPIHIMAIKLIANYSKRLGLPGYSSHQFSVSVESELSASDDIAAESTRLYQLLQSNVDEQMLRTGFVPPGDYGMEDARNSPAPADGTITQIHGNTPWKCSGKQKDLILKLVDEHALDKNEVDHLARQRFGKGVRQLNKIEASGLIDELLETYGGSQRPEAPRGSRTAYQGAQGAHGRRAA